MHRYVVIITGASGSAYGMRLVEQLARHGELTLIFTEKAAEVTEQELGFALPAEGGREAVLRYLELPSDTALRVVPSTRLFDPAASDASPVDAVIVAPASMGFLGSVAAGVASDLAERVVEVALKERRPLVVVPRETPLSLIHLRSLVSLAEAGAVVVPAMPAFRQRPSSIDDIVNFVVGKVLDVLGIEHTLLER